MFFGAAGDGVAEEHFFVAGFEGREVSRLGEVAGVEIGVEILEQLHERVGIAFGMAAGIGGVSAGFGAHQRWVFD